MLPSCASGVLRVSLPVRGAWIEIRIMKTVHLTADRSLPVRGAWIEIWRTSTSRRTPTSLPVRGAWIEIHRLTEWHHNRQVAPRAGSVD